MTGPGAFVVVQLLAVVAVVAFALALWIFLRRVAQVLAETRELERFRRSASDLAERIGLSLDGVAARIDAVRRHTLPAEAIGDNLTAAADAIERYMVEARTLSGPPEARDLRDRIVAELERAGRALQMAEHGCSILASARVGGREIEAQTSVKRGYLNLLHAREAIARHAADAEALAGSGDVRLFGRPGTATSRGSTAARDHRI